MVRAEAPSQVCQAYGAEHGQIASTQAAVAEAKRNETDVGWVKEWRPLFRGLLATDSGASVVDYLSVNPRVFPCRFRSKRQIVAQVLIEAVWQAPQIAIFVFIGGDFTYTLTIRTRGTALKRNKATSIV